MRFTKLEKCVSKPHIRSMIYVLAFPVFDQPIAERIRAFRELHEPQRAKLVPPHITLVFGVANTHLETVSGLVETVSRRTTPIPVAFDSYVTEFDPFEKKYKIFLLCNEGSMAIKALHERLYEGAHRSELSASHPFRPHMTIGTFDTQSDVDQVDVAAAGKLPITGQVSALKLVQLEDGRLSTLRTVPFPK